MRNAELLGNHFKPVLIIKQQFLNNSDFGFSQFIISGLPGQQPIF